MSPTTRTVPYLAISLLLIAPILLFSCARATDLAAALPRPEAEPEYTAADLATEVHTVHAPLGIPYGTPVSNDLIFRHNYTASTNDETKFADWVAYTVTSALIGEPSDPPRNYRADPFLADEETLEARPGMGDYEDAHASENYDRGHLVPLRSFHGSPYVQEVNLFSVMAPQIDDLNRGPWKSLEGAVRRLVEDHADVESVYVLAGPYYDPGSQQMPDLPLADEVHVVPNGFWMIVYTTSDALQVCAFAVPQRLPSLRDAEQFVTSVDVVEALSGLDLFSPIEDETEVEFEQTVGVEWYRTW